MAGDRTTNFGGRLREARERRGISLRQIANATKISVGLLEALERNDISRLPGGIFSRAFVRSYAIEVGLDPERTIQEFITLFPGDSVTAGHPVSHQVAADVVAESRRRRVSGVFSALAFGSVVISAAVYSGGFRALASYVAPLLSLQEWRLPALIRPDASVRRAQAESAASRSAPAGAPAPSEIVPTTPPVSPPIPHVAASTDKRLTVRLSVSRPCWISATVDGKKVIERLLQLGDEQTIAVYRELVLTAADAGAVELTLNGESAKPLGTAGEVVTARLNLANFRDFLSIR
jgi:cytoskeleton protein RodZ